ncbi:helix-turn-helix domain-containing protein [Microbacterium sp.]|uniref:helix-turn-helix domain-containing protein n=1 Tax=Microbacterium sp. TaxID=51671 RepID=UPI0039E5D2F5
MRSLPIEPEGHRASIGPRLRAARQAQHLTIGEVARITGLTKGFLSRVERDRTSPSVATLVALCEVLSVPLGSLFEAPEVAVVRAGAGPRLNLGGVGTEDRLLSPRHDSRLQVLRSHIDSGGHGGEELYSLAAEVDVLHVISGDVLLRLPEREWRLGPGDTATFNGREPHSWTVVSEEGADVIWVLVPALWSL